MKFADFELGFSSVEAGERLNWPRGSVTVSGSADPLFRRELEERFSFGIGVEFREDASLGEEACRLEISPAGAVLAASGRRGFLYGVETLCRFGGVEELCESRLHKLPEFKKAPFESPIAGVCFPMLEFAISGQILRF